MTIMIWFNITVVVFTVANLMAGGLECDLKGALKWMRNPKLIVPCLVWGWVVGPAVAWLLIQVLPLTEGLAAGLMLTSLAPIAPFLPMAASKARGDMTFTGAYILLGTIFTVVLMPVMAPLLIKGLTVSAWPLAKPLITLVLIPLLIGDCDPVLQAGSGRQDFSVGQEDRRSFPAALFGDDSVDLRQGHAQHGRQFAPAAWVIFMVVMAILPYVIGFGLKQNQRSVMAIGQSSRNISAGFVAFFGITEPARRDVPARVAGGPDPHRHRASCRAAHLREAGRQGWGRGLGGNITQVTT